MSFLRATVYSLCLCSPFVLTRPSNPILNPQWLDFFPSVTLRLGKKILNQCLGSEELICRRSRVSGKFIDAKFVCTRYGNDPESPQPAFTTTVPVKKKRGRLNRSWSKTDCKAGMHVKRRQDGRWVVCSFEKEHNHDTFPDQGYYSRDDTCLALGNNNANAIAGRSKRLHVLTSTQAGGHKKLDRHKGGDSNRFRSCQILGLEEEDLQVLLDRFNFADQTKLTYAWLMRAWLRSMGGNAPKVVLTDHDKALKEAVVEVFPDSRHCFCLWHILSKIPEKLSYVHGQHEDFMAKFDECIFKTYTDEQFEKKWWELVEGFNLRNDLWFRSLYEDRQKWVPTYMRGIFLAAMSTMQRSDSVSSFFDRYLQRKTMLKEFLDQYKTLLLEKSEEEAKANFETWHKPPGLKSPSLFEKQMASFYTHAVFKKFQVEVLGGIACHPRKESEEGGIATFKVQDFEKNQDFVVVWNDTTSDISCLCRGFEFNGFPCRHILIILQLSGVQSIPSQHILKRWTKDAKHRQTIGKQSDVVETRMQRYNDLCQRAFKLGDEGSLSQESYNIVFNALDEALRKCESVNYSIQTVTRPMSPQTQGPHHFEEVNQNSSTTKPVKKIKTSLKRQGYPETEISNTGKCNNWQQVGVSNIGVPNLECSYESQESIHRMEQLNSRTPALDSCFGTQLMQGMGQLNSIGPPHDAHYIAQQRMNGMGQLPFRPQSIPGCYDIHGLQDMDQPNPRSSQASLTKIGMSVERIHERS
ncbi:hypothetical protein V6N13_115384 [Hibiscus sabdariffa]